MSPEPAASKQEVRRRGRNARRELNDRAERSSRIGGRIHSLDQYQNANSVCCYVHARYEVQTLGLIERRLRQQMPTFVPYCCGDQLRLFRLQEIGQLEIGRFGILEPLDSLRSDRAEVDVNGIELFLVPGVAFDLKCRRIGQGAGFYDRLLARCKDKTLVGLAFDCQVFSEITTEQHDISMDIIVTESRVIGHF